MFESIKKRLEEFATAADEIKAAAAPRIEDKLRADATTKRGNVPSFGPMGNVPIHAEPIPEGIAVTGPDWVMEKARELGQVDQWTEITLDETARVLGYDK
jgi:hypothetical protein